MDKLEIAVNNFNSGLNCCQAVVLAFKDEIGVDERMLKKLSIAFGGGLGRQRLTCGAVSGMCMVLGAMLSNGNDKLENYEIVKKACADFKKEAGSIICSELLENQNAKKPSCAKLCQIATKIAQNYIDELKK